MENSKPHSLWMVCTILIVVLVVHGAWTRDKLIYTRILNKAQILLSTKEDTTKEDAAILASIINNTDDKRNTAPTTEVHKTKDTIHIGFVGDIIPGIDAYPNMFSDITSYTEKPEVMIANFEGAATDSIFSKCKIDSKNCFSFNGNDIFLKLLRDASFDVLNVANNHFNDYREVGQIDTIRNIREIGLIPSGMKGEVTYITKNNIKISLVGFSNYSWTNDLNRTNEVANLIQEADKDADIVVVVFHGGGEGASYSHTPREVEWYLGENRGDLRAFAHNAIDSGADLVLGSGPHVLRGIEWYENKLIAYSLGNFAMADGILTTGTLKNSGMLNVTLDKHGSKISGNIESFEIDRYGIPRPDLSNTAITIINNLSQSDFGEQGVKLNPLGEIKIK